MPISKVTAVVALVLVQGILATAAAAQKDTGKNDPVRPRSNGVQGDVQPKGATVVVDNARIVIAPGQRYHVSQVKTASGGRVRLEVPGITVEVPRLTIEVEGRSIFLEATEAGKLKARIINDPTSAAPPNPPPAPVSPSQPAPPSR